MSNYYIAGPMRGVPHFNYAAFDKAARELTREGHYVFNPANRDEQIYGTALFSTNATGSIEQAVEDFDFNLREALAYDLRFICEQATGVYLLKGWENSKGARAERALAEALGLEIRYQTLDWGPGTPEYQLGRSNGYGEGYSDGFDDALERERY